MLRIRFFRIGKKHQPSFKIVVTDKRKPPKGGRFVEQVGFYNPLTKEKNLKEDRIKYWLSVGAKPSSTVYNLLVQEKIVEGGKRAVHNREKKKEEKTVPAVKKEKPIEDTKEKTLPKEKGKEEVPKEAKDTTQKEELPPAVEEKKEKAEGEEKAEKKGEKATKETAKKEEKEEQQKTKQESAAGEPPAKEEKGERK